MTGSPGSARRHRAPVGRRRVPARPAPPCPLRAAHSPAGPFPGPPPSLRAGSGSYRPVPRGGVSSPSPCRAGQAFPAAGRVQAGPDLTGRPERSVRGRDPTDGPLSGTRTAPGRPPDGEPSTADDPLLTIEEVTAELRVSWDAFYPGAGREPARRQYGCRAAGSGSVGRRRPRALHVIQARPLADGFLTDLKDAVRERRPFNPRTGLPGAGATADGEPVTWYSTHAPTPRRNGRTWPWSPAGHSPRPWPP